MYINYNNTLAVQASWLDDQNIISLANYKKMNQRGLLRVINRACKGTPVLIDFQSLPSRFQAKVIDIAGHPARATEKPAIYEFLENDLKAVEYFTTFTLQNGEALPQKNIAEYCATASILNAVHGIVNKRTAIRKAAGASTQGLWDVVVDMVHELPAHTYPHNLPTNVRRFKLKYKKYMQQGYAALVHKGFGNDNSEKINDNAKRWLINRWADRVNKVANVMQLFGEYNALAKQEGWKPLKSETTIYNYLHQEEIVHLWFGHRSGELKSKEKFALQFKTKMPTMRDSLWYSDGTKLNYYYQDENGRMQTCQVYEVMDAYSEVLLGYHISHTEDFEAQYNAYKMAVKVSGHRPYQLGFDNQGGHKKLENGNFLSKLARISIKTQPYNGKSKTIESAFGRFQQQFLKRDWFFTGQNIQAKSIESKANLEFIMANKTNLPTLAEIKEIYRQRRNEWNDAIHSKTGLPRMQMYVKSNNPQAPEIQLWDMVDLFWITRPKTIQLSAQGIVFKEKGVEHSYMVYAKDGMPDIGWLKRNIDRKFTVKFDPEDMTAIQLYYKDRYITTATKVIEIHRGKQEQEEWEASYISKVIEKNKVERLASAQEMDEILAEFGALPEDYGLVTPKLKGISTKQTFGSIQKKQSNQTPDQDEDDSIYALL